jgi:glutathione S-transferase
MSVRLEWSFVFVWLNVDPVPLKQIYVDTSLILEALEHWFPASDGYGTIYPNPGPWATDDHSYRPLVRGFASYWTDRPLFRVTTGLIPGRVWRTRFGHDRSNLIGHRLDADKLEGKLVQNLSGLDLHLSVLEPLFSSNNRQWIFDGPTPSAADISLYYQLDWAEKISRGEGVEDLTGGGTSDSVGGEGIADVFNAERYPGLTAWFDRVRRFFADGNTQETRVAKGDARGARDVVARIAASKFPDVVPLIPTPARPNRALDGRNGLAPGSPVSVAPDDTGRDSPTRGTLVAVTPEEVVITPDDDGVESRTRLYPNVGKVRIHFPRTGFVVRPVGRARL